LSLEISDAAGGVILSFTGETWIVSVFSGACGFLREAFSALLGETGVVCLVIRLF